MFWPQDLLERSSLAWGYKKICPNNLRFSEPSRDLDIMLMALQAWPPSSALWSQVESKSQPRWPPCWVVLGKFHNLSESQFPQPRYRDNSSLRLLKGCSKIHKWRHLAPRFSLNAMVFPLLVKLATVRFLDHMAPQSFYL